MVDDFVYNYTNCVSKSVLKRGYFANVAFCNWVRLNKITPTLNAPIDFDFRILTDKWTQLYLIGFDK